MLTTSLSVRRYTEILCLENLGEHPVVHYNWNYQSFEPTKLYNVAKFWDYRSEGWQYGKCLYFHLGRVLALQWIRIFDNSIQQKWLKLGKTLEISS